VAAQIETHYKNNFTAAIRLEAQQLQSKLSSVWQFEPITGEKQYFDTYGSVDLTERTSRNQANTYQEASRDRRMIATQYFEYSELFDKRDNFKLMKAMEPDSQFMKMVLASVKRKIDSTILTAFTATAYSGKAGGTSNTFAAANLWTQTEKAAVDATYNENSSLVADDIRKAREILDTADVDLDSQPVYLICHPTQYYHLMESTTFTSQDFVSYRPSETGVIPVVMGMQVIKTSLVPAQTFTTAAGHYAYVVVPSGGVWGWNRDVEVSIDTIPERGNAVQLAVYADMAATRLFEDQIIAIECEDVRVDNT